MAYSTGGNSGDLPELAHYDQPIAVPREDEGLQRTYQNVSPAEILAVENKDANPSIAVSKKDVIFRVPKRVCLIVSTIVLTCVAIGAGIGIGVGIGLNRSSHNRYESPSLFTASGINLTAFLQLTAYNDIDIDPVVF